MQFIQQNLLNIFYVAKTLLGTKDKSVKKTLCSDGAYREWTIIGLNHSHTVFGHDRFSGHILTNVM